MSGEFNLFGEEEALVAASRAAQNEGDEATRLATLPLLLQGYEKLLRETRQLIKISDRREKEMNRLNRRLEQATSTLAYQAEHDPLTGLLNKGAIRLRLDEALAAGSCALILLDIDHFKAVNDTYGHLAGDLLLRGLGERVQEQLAPDDLLGRFGGEEFLLVLRQPSLIQARAAAERVRRAVADSPFECGDHLLSVTISLGVTLGQMGEDYTPAFQRLDQALYAAKGGGRNRIEVGEP